MDADTCLDCSDEPLLPASTHQYACLFAHYSLLYFVLPLVARLSLLRFLLFRLRSRQVVRYSLYYIRDKCDEYLLSTLPTLLPLNRLSVSYTLIYSKRSFVSSHHLLLTLMKE